MEMKELSFRQDSKVLHETFIRPSRPEQPLIKVRENLELYKYEAVFTIEFVGIRKNLRTENVKEQLNLEKKHLYRYVGHVLSGLKENQRIDLFYCIERHGLKRRNFRWQIMGYTLGDSSEEAIVNALHLAQNVQVVLGSVESSYLFHPVTESQELTNSQQKEICVGYITPLGFPLHIENGKTVGFRRDQCLTNNKTGIAFLPDNIRRDSTTLDSVIIGSYGWDASYTLSISLIPVTLCDEELKKLHVAKKWLESGMTGNGYLQNLSSSLENDDKVKNLMSSLELWLRNPVGYQIKCAVLSEDPIPLSLLTIIGDELFNSYKVYTKLITLDEETATRFDDNNDAENIPVWLDLGSFVHSSLDLPPLFPGVDTLINAGTKRIYNCRTVELSENGILLGNIKNSQSDKKVLFAKSDRSRHCYIIGSTGTGKSTLLYNMIMQDINNDEGVTVIDPHGDLYQQVLKSIPKRRIQEVVLVDLCDFEYSVGINFLECYEPYKAVQMNYVVNEMIKIFDRLYDLRKTGGPMFEHYMRSALLLVMDNDFEGATLMDIPLIFEDPGYRRFLLDRCKNPIGVNFWKKQAERAGGEAALGNMAPYITSKLNQFTMNALLRPIIGQPESTINFRKIMDKSKILLVNLSKGLIGELDAQLLGMLIIGKIFSSAMSRVSLRPEQRKAMFLYVDEFQNFTTDSVAHLLSEARKFGIYLTLANQNLSQISNNSGRHNILDAVLGNVGTTLIFRLGPMDAEKMQSYTKPELEAQDLQDLPDYHVAGRILVKNSPSKPLVFRTLPIRITRDNADVYAVKSMSRHKYAKQTKLIEEEIIARLTDYKNFAKDCKENN